MELAFASLHQLCASSLDRLGLLQSPRLLAEPIALVFAARDAPEELPGIPQFEVRELGNEDARALLASEARFLPDERVRDQILTEARGNPLALIELPRGMSAGDVVAGFGFLGAHTLSGRIEESFRRQLERLPEDARRVRVNPEASGRVPVMTTAIIGTGGLGSVIAHRLASGGEPLRLASADSDAARKLAATVGGAAVAALDNRDAVRGADAVVLALRFGVLKAVIDEIGDQLADKLVVVPSNPVGIDAEGNLIHLLPKGQSSGEVVTGWLPASARLAMAFGTMSANLLESSSNRSPEPAVLFYATDDLRAGEEVERLIRAAGFEPVLAGGVEQSGRLEVDGDLHDLVVGPAEARSLIGGAVPLR
jgi:8-hydroxy-5-deazaflavin:NADPH oxidoreductase